MTATNTTNCQHQHARCIKSEGGTKTGAFTEIYECPCGATGRVTGDAEEPPSQWRRTGEVFN